MEQMAPPEMPVILASGSGKCFLIYPTIPMLYGRNIPVPYIFIFISGYAAIASAALE
jgi:hypothetical protein